MTGSASGGAWRPLASPVYRRLWLAQVVANLGTWMQTIGAQWLIVSDTGSAFLIGHFQTASTLPVVLLAAPAGVLADILDRRPGPPALFGGLASSADCACSAR